MPCWASDMSGKYGTKKLFQTIPTGLACAHLASGIRHPASDIWQLATGIWYLTSGMETGMSLRSHRIFGLNMLRPFAWNHTNVGTCWHLLRTV